MSKEEDDKLKKAAEAQKRRMMKFDVQPARTAKEQTVINKAGKTWTDKSKDVN